MNERETIDRGWFYVKEPEDGRWAPAERLLRASDGVGLTRRLHGHPSRVEVHDESGDHLPAATLLRAAGAVGRTLERRDLDSPPEVLVRLGPAGTPLRISDHPDGRCLVVLDGPALAASPSPHPLEDTIAAAWPTPLPSLKRQQTDGSGLPSSPLPRAMFFESLMNTDMPHNDKEISQGVLHLVSPLEGLDTEVVLVNVKMPIEGDIRPVHGLEHLQQALADSDVQLVAITLLEGYWHGVLKLIKTLRDLGSRARIAVGGVMPSLAPEHVAAHLPEVNFVCRGAGEVFLPELVRILGDSNADDPLTEAQREALLKMDGMIVLDHAPTTGRRLLSCRSDLTVQVSSMDRIPLNLSHVQKRHIEGGIEIATSRGCIHKCTFCSILGRESYQARSAGSIFDVLSQYEQRFLELYGDDIPNNAYRVHISDDDFACDRERAIEFFEALRRTRFRLSSVQVAVGDLCVRRDGKLLAEPDHELLDAMDARCFADHGRPIPINDFFEDHKSRNWSSFLQIGVETYSDREIARLGKGYRRVHVRTIVAELARRDLHMDGYFILCNADTTADDLVDVFSEVARLKLRFPLHFHMRFPVVQRLVSYFTAASHRRHVRKGRGHVMELRDHAHVPNHGELDYPFVEHDIPTDEVVADTVSTTFVTDDGLYTGNLTVLRDMWRQRLTGTESPEETRLKRLVRRLDDRGRWLIFEMLRQAWRQDDSAWPGARLDREACLATAERVLGPKKNWFQPFRTFWREPDHRRVVLEVLSNNGTPLDASAWREAILFALSTNRSETIVELLGGDAPVSATWLADRLDEARKLARHRLHPQPVRFVIDVRLIAADDAETLASDDVVFALGCHPNHAMPHPSVLRSAAAHRLQAVVHVSPENTEDLPSRIGELADLGIGAIQVQPTAERWDRAALQALAKALFSTADLWGPSVDFMGLDQPTTLLKGVAVTYEGQIVRADALRLPPEQRAPYRLAALDALTNVDRHAIDLADPASTPRLLGVDAQLAQRQPAIAVIQKFTTWLATSRATAATP